MALECLLLTQDAALLNAIRPKFAELGVEIVMRNDAGLAVELSNRRHLDGFLIDCDDVPGGREALIQIPASPANQKSIVLGIVNGGTSIAQALEIGAQFVLTKPLQEERLCSFLDFAIPKMEREHRRYFRHAIDLPIQLQLHDERTLTAKMQNVSEGGFAMRSIAERLPEGVLSVAFQLPSLEGDKVRGRAVVVWASDFFTGLRFLYIDPRCRPGFQAWLTSLEGQLRFRESVRVART
jgi:CheY-like chemotaxis protein